MLPDDEGALYDDELLPDVLPEYPLDDELRLLEPVPYDDELPDELLPLVLPEFISDDEEELLPEELPL